MASERTVKIKFTGESKGLDKAASSAESKLKKFGGRITSSLQAATDKLPGILSGAISALPPQGQALALAIVGGLGVALSAAIGAALSSAIMLALGGGVLALGIKSAIDNPKVAAAFDGLKKKATKVWDSFGKPFEGPLIRAAGTFGKVLDSLKPAIDRLGKIIAPVIDKLAPALGEFLKQMMPGIEEAVKGAVPLFNILAEKLPHIGREIGNFFAKISANGEDTNQFWADLLDFITGLIIVLGTVIAKLASWYSNVRNFVVQAIARFREFRVAVINELGRVLDAATSALGWIPGIGPKLQAANRRFQTFRIEANKELARIKDRQVRINVWSNVASVVADVGRQLASISGSGKSGGRRASGGPVSAGRSYLVGERGPEVITMQGNGHVTPNRDLGGGDVFEAHIHLADDVVKVIRMERRDMKRRAGMRGAHA